MLNLTRAVFLEYQESSVENWETLPDIIADLIKCGEIVYVPL